MFDMINHTPAALERILSQEQSVIQSVSAVIASSRINKVLLVGIGTSWHAALNADYYFKTVAGLPHVEAWHSMDFVQRSPPVDDKTAVIIFSHRGVKTFSFEACVRSKNSGCYTVLLTSLDSPINESLGLDAIIRTSKGEQSSAFTVSHTSSTFVALMLSVYIGLGRKVDQAAGLEQHLNKIPNLLQSIINHDHQMYKSWAARVKDLRYLPFVAYLGNVSNTYEVGLKINEAVYMYAQGFNVEQFIHGPFVAVDENTGLTAIISKEDGKERTLQLLKAAKHVGVKVSLITSDCDYTSAEVVGKDCIISLPDVPEPISVLTNLVALQLLTYYLAMERKTDPDMFRRDLPLHSDAFVVSGLNL
ncbi:hypothetical protein SAMD00019534_048560 [Acytostelium subglobosum LB1]|uniref:hypothetical protein n=1 Tax=Acytostelium subglobosum LB1 TaxID=1410327 RepID=UPI000644B95E|nr:hypothetical protein SAMD00019534_048560 [Acytostelium subglobosum LB1]GAM21681.1 hypothetical protein SAMD00019534_048560 [Acytostelium subglobosum LB1]|eukprot:XP_012755800.1 hypothetical protein SAMD00019534_048560 [Acytostelium subglobosum LB1]